MILIALSTFCALIAAGCSVVIFRHAFARSVGTGVMVLCVPFYVVHYAVTQFEHGKREWILGAWFCSLGLAAVLFAVGAPAIVSAMPLAPAAP